MKRMHEMPFGARPDGKGGARFRLWAPGAQRVELIRSGGGLDQGTYPMQARPAGWFELDMARARRAHRLCVPHRPPDRRARPGLAR